MPVRIDSINVSHLGPLDEFQMDFGDVNLIYAHNEMGKTHLVEFIIQSLFKKGAIGQLRSLEGCRGEIHVSGINDHPMSFNAQSRGRKLEDTLTDKITSMPPSIARMLVVRAGELALVKDSYGGVNRAIIKEFLANEGFLDEVAKGISKTIQAAHIEFNGEISGNNTGEIKARSDKLQQLKTLDQLLFNLDEVYSDGDLTVLKVQQKETQDKLDLLEQARRHMAWKLFQKMERIDDEKNKYPYDQIEKLQREVWQYKELSKRISEKEILLKEKQTQCKHYSWLVEAVRIYKDSTGSINGENIEPTLPRPKMAVLFWVGVCLFVGGIFSFVQLPVLTLISILLASGLGIWYIRMTLAFATQATDALVARTTNLKEIVDLKEREAIGAEFFLRFNIPFSGLAVMEEQHNKLRSEKAAVDYLSTDLDNDRRNMEAFGQSIYNKLVQLSIKSVESEQWEQAISALLSHLDKIENDYNKIQRQSDLLNVLAENYLAQDPGIDYDSFVYDKCCAEMEKLKQQIKVEIDLKINLKMAIAREIEGDPYMEWEDLIQSLKGYRQKVSQEYRILTSQIAAGALVFQVLSSLRQEEDLCIQEGLQSDLVKKPLKSLTRRYEQLSLDGDRLKVNDGYGDFFLSDLSTGAQEQILLALRIGFSQRCMEQNSLFLILDDAFQNSDWERRVWLVDEMIDIAQQGWQIIYFTMDDHIRGLFESRVKPIFGNQYHFRELLEKE